MKHALVAVIAVGLSGAAIAQTPPANPSPETPAVQGSDAPAPAMPAMPAKGANSFTEAQAKQRIEAKGFTNVSALKKDADGVWRGKAMKGGATQDVALDYQGNVFPH